ncbi:MAG TPA: pilus assembly PilX N-terminal domain-containing protein, partial [Gemmatimonadaceae bacterium]|nr:pilus assembly PilX N-terminal domain-containing protein [Gemmatimonadaceae bacterium]
MLIEKTIASDRRQTNQAHPHVRKGFVLPTVMFSVAVMSIVVVAAINTASDERRTSRATRESTLALYAA